MYGICHAPKNLQQIIAMENVDPIDTIVYERRQNLLSFWSCKQVIHDAR